MKQETDLSDSLHRCYCQMEARKNLLGKTHGGNSRQEIWVGTMAQALNSPSYEAAKFKHIYLHWLKDVIVRNKFPEKENIKVQTRC